MTQFKKRRDWRPPPPFLSRLSLPQERTRSGFKEPLFSSLVHKRRLTISSSKLLSSRRNERTRWGEASGFKSLPYALRWRPSQIQSQGSIKPLKLVQIVVTVFVPAFNEILSCISLSNSLSFTRKGTKYQTIWEWFWVRRAYDKSKQTMSIEDDSWDLPQSQRKRRMS